jgi:hypothetical protein
LRAVGRPNTRERRPWVIWTSRTALGGLRLWPQSPATGGRQQVGVITLASVKGARVALCRRTHPRGGKREEHWLSPLVLGQGARGSDCRLLFATVHRP